MTAARKLHDCAGCGGKSDGRHIDRELLKEAVVDGVPPLSQTHCSQCGQPWESPACGPTHALIANERQRRT